MSKSLYSADFWPQILDLNYLIPLKTASFKQNTPGNTSIPFLVTFNSLLCIHLSSFLEIWGFLSVCVNCELVILMLRIYFYKYIFKFQFRNHYWLKKEFNAISLLDGVPFLVTLTFPFKSPFAASFLTIPLFMRLSAAFYL